MGCNEILPKYGEEYEIVEYSSKIFDGHNRFKGIYIGFNPNETIWFRKIDFPEGYVFVAKKGENNGFEIYCTRSDRLEETWLSDGDDGPEYPIGIQVSKVEIKLRENEIEYLNRLFTRKNGLRRAA